MRVIGRYGLPHRFIGPREYHLQRQNKPQYLPEINVDIYGTIEYISTFNLSFSMRATWEASIMDIFPNE